MYRRCMLAALAAVVVLSVRADAAGAGEGHDHPHEAKAVKEASGPLDALKKLEGPWAGKAGTGEQTFEVNVSYRVTAGGNAVTETLFEGTPHEMMTVYYVQGGEVALTHYCTSGHHPRMKLAKGAKADGYVFEFAGATNFDPAKDPHMHSARMWFDGDDHVKSEWQSWDGGKPGHLARFDLTRVR
jgi:hypothetical protein